MSNDQQENQRTEKMESGSIGSSFPAFLSSYFFLNKSSCILLPQLPQLLLGCSLPLYWSRTVESELPAFFLPCFPKLKYDSMWMKGGGGVHLPLPHSHTFHSSSTLNHPDVQIWPKYYTQTGEISVFPCLCHVAHMTLFFSISPECQRFWNVWLPAQCWFENDHITWNVLFWSPPAHAVSPSVSLCTSYMLPDPHISSSVSPSSQTACWLWDVRRRIPQRRKWGFQWLSR